MLMTSSQSIPGVRPGFCPDVVAFCAAIARRLPVRRIVGVGLPDWGHLQDREPEFEVAALAQDSSLLTPTAPGLTSVPSTAEWAAALNDSLVVVGPLTAPEVIERLIHRGGPRLPWKGLVLSSVNDSRLGAGGGRDIRTMAEIEALLDTEGLTPIVTGYSRTSADESGRAVRIHYLPGLEWEAGLARKAPLPDVIAVIPCYNERDILPTTVGRLVDQGIRVHVVDNWSNDGSWEFIDEMASANLLVTAERFPQEPSRHHEWELMLNRLDDAGAASGADWILHVDADEQFESFSSNLGLREAIGVVDQLGYDAIDFTVADFRPTSAQPDHSLPVMWEFGTRTGHLHIQRGWRNRGSRVGIAQSGGHVIPDPKRLFPFNFVLRHYPLRSPEHALQKIYRDRLPRYDGSPGTQKGWHRQYDGFDTKDPFLWDGHSLHPWSSETRDEWMVEFTTRAGLTFGQGSYERSPFAQGTDEGQAAEDTLADRRLTLRERYRRFRTGKVRNATNTQGG